MEKRIFYCALIVVATTYVAYHISFLKNTVWSQTATVTP